MIRRMKWRPFLVNLAIFGVMVFLFYIGISQLNDMKDKEATWLPATGVVTASSFEVYKNPDYDPDEDASYLEYRGKATVDFEYYREDGSLWEDRYVESGLSPDDTAPPIGTEFDMIYDPDSDSTDHEGYPDTGGYVMSYILIVVGALGIILYIYLVLRYVYRSTKYDPGV